MSKTEEAAGTMKELTAADIYAAKDITVERVDVPEWGGFVYVRALSGTQREKYVESIRRITGKGKNKDVEIVLKESGAKLAAQTLCNAKGELLFPDAAEFQGPGTHPDIKRLGDKSAKALQRVIDKSAELNGLSDEGDEEAKNDSASVPA